jgi:anaerobic selenocysteine-containing dehydrogenase
MENLEFTVAVDLYVNETSRHAHLVLPPRYALERGHYDLLFHNFAVRNTAKWSEPVIAPAPGTLDDWDILVGLASRLLAARPLGGVPGRILQWMGRLGPDRLVDTLIRLGPHGDRFLPGGKGISLAALKRAPHGVDLGPLLPMARTRVRTRSGKVNLAPPALLADTARVETWMRERDTEGLVLIGRRHLRNNNSWMQNAPSLVKGPDRSMLLMNPADAQRLGLSSGAMVRVQSRVGAIEARLLLTEDVMPGVLSLPHGHGHGAAAATLRVAAAVPGANVNAITDDALLEPLTASAILSGVPVTVEALAG